MKQNQKERDTQEQPKHTENKEEHPEPKNIQVVSASGGHTETNIDLLKVLNFVQETMQTLSNYSEQLQTHLDINLTRNVVNLSKYLNLSKSNLTYKEHAAMEELAKGKHLIITNADKGGAVVIMGTDSYIKEANRQLSDKASYKQLTQDPILKHNRTWSIKQ